MRIKTMLQTTAVLGLAVVAGLLGVGGTWALWNVSVPSDAGVIQAADFNVEINNARMASDVRATLKPENPNAVLTPDVRVYSTATIKNASNAGGAFDISAALGTEPTNTTDSVLASHVQVAVAANPSSAACSELDYSNGSTSAVVPKGKSTTFCLRFSLPASAPQSIANTSGSVTLPVSVTQIPSN